MTKFYLIIFIIISGMFSIKAQTNPDTIWTKTIGGSYVEAFGEDNTQTKSKISLSYDEKSLYIGTTTASGDGDVSDSLGNLDGWIVKMNLDGDTLWTDVFGGSGFDYLSDITATPDGGVVICGFSNSQDVDFANTKLHTNINLPDLDFMTDGFIAKYTAEGKKEWVKYYGGRPLADLTSMGQDELYEIIVTKDGNYLAVGYTYSETDDLPVDYDKYRGAWFLKVDKTGKIILSDKLVSPTHNENSSNKFYDVVEQEENIFYLIGWQGYMREIAGGFIIEDFFWAVKTDGVTIFAQDEYGIPNTSTYASSICKGPDNTFFAVGSHYGTGGDVQTSNGKLDVWLIQLDSDLNLVDQNSFGGSENDYPFQVVSDNFGHYFMVGYSTSTDLYAEGSFGGSDFWAVNFDDNLDFLQSYKAGGSLSDALTDAVFSKDGKTLFLTGRTESNENYVHNNHGYTDIWVSKITQDVTLGVKDISGNVSNIDIFPNPSKGNIQINNYKNSSYSISDITGKSILNGTLNSDNEILNLDNLQNGIYFINIHSISENGTTETSKTGRFVISK